MLAQKVARKIPEKCRDKSHTIVDTHFACGFVTDFRTGFARRATKFAQNLNSMDAQVSEIGSGDVSGIGSGDVSQVGSGDVPQIGSGDVPEIGSRDVPEIGSGDVSEVGCGDVFQIGFC